MITKHVHGDVVWINLLHPTESEAKEIMNTYNVDPLIMQDLLTPTPRQHITKRGQHLYVVFHFPAFKQTHSAEHGFVQEVDFVLGKNLIITTHYDTIDAIHLFNKEVETEEILHRKEISFFYSLLKNLYSGILNELCYIESWTQGVEQRIFDGKEREMVIELSHIIRNIINLKQTIFPHGEILKTLEKMDTAISDSHFSDTAYKNIYNDYERIAKTVNDIGETVSALRETNDSLLSSKQNEVMKTLTIIAFLTLPASLIASIFNMSVDLPITDGPYDFWIILTSMIVVSGSLFVFLKRKKWL